MDIKQVYQIANDITTEVLGKSDLLTEDLTNIVDVGKEIFDNVSYDKYVQSLCDHIGRVVFVDRTYEGTSAELKRDSWEYGAVMEKVYETELPEAVENESWELTDRASYDPNVFTKPKVAAKFYNKRTTFEVDRSLTDLQVKSAFSNPGQLNAFFSMLSSNTQKALTIKTDALAERAINYLILNTVNSAFPSVSNNNYSGMTSVKAVNLLYMYNQAYSKSLTAAAAVIDPDFIRFAAYQMALGVNRLKKVSTLFNAGAIERFTPASLQHIILHADFKAAADVFLQSDVFHDEFTRLPAATSVPYWQGSGLDYGFSSTSTIKGTIAVGDSTKSITMSGVLGVIFDHDAAGIVCENSRVTTQYNPKAEFTNWFYKEDAGYYIDSNENAIVYYVQ